VTPVFGSAHGALVRMLTLLETLTGVVTIALMISYLVIAIGAPGSDVEMPYRSLAEWQMWTADVLEIHVSYPMLALFRSQHPGQSWVTAARRGDRRGDVDVGLCGRSAERESYFQYRQGRRAVMEISSRLHVPATVMPAMWLVEENLNWLGDNSSPSACRSVTRTRRGRTCGHCVGPTATNSGA
jgi:hypothetical protein